MRVRARAPCARVRALTLPRAPPSPGAHRRRRTGGRKGTASASIPRSRSRSRSHPPHTHTHTRVRADVALRRMAGCGRRYACRGAMWCRAAAVTSWAGAPLFGFVPALECASHRNRTHTDARVCAHARTHAHARTRARAQSDARRAARAGVQWCVCGNARHARRRMEGALRGAGAGEDVGAGAPRWAQAVMANGFRTPQGALAVLGLHALPAWLWAGATCALGGGGAFARALGVPLMTARGWWWRARRRGAAARRRGRGLGPRAPRGGMLAADAGERARARERP